MIEFFILFDNWSQNTLGSGATCLIALCALFILFVTFFFVWFFYGKLSKKALCAYFLFSAFIILFEFSIESLARTQIMVGFSLASCFLFFSILFCLPSRTIKATEQQLEFARLIDRKVKNQQNIKALKEQEHTNLIKKQEVESIKLRQETEQKPIEVDFTHVKNVLKRLEYYNLNITDKKQVKELENAILIAEKGEVDLKTKRNINEGLGALLKIMSKYGV